MLLKRKVCAEWPAMEDLDAMVWSKPFLWLGPGFYTVGRASAGFTSSALVSSMQNAKNCADVRAWSQRRDFSREVLSVTVAFFWDLLCRARTPVLPGTRKWWS